MNYNERSASCIEIRSLPLFAFAHFSDFTFAHFSDFHGNVKGGDMQAFIEAGARAW